MEAHSLQQMLLFFFKFPLVHHLRSFSICPPSPHTQRSLTCCLALCQLISDLHIFSKEGYLCSHQHALWDSGPVPRGGDVSVASQLQHQRGHGPPVVLHRGTRAGTQVRLTAHMYTNTHSHCQMISGENYTIKKNSVSHFDYFELKATDWLLSPAPFIPRNYTLHD